MLVTTVGPHTAGGGPFIHSVTSRGWPHARHWRFRSEQDGHRSCLPYILSGRQTDSLSYANHFIEEPLVREKAAYKCFLSWMRGYYSSWMERLEQCWHSCVGRRDSACYSKKKTYRAITMSRWRKFSSCQKKTLHCKLLSVELLKDTEVQSVCKRGASDLLACFLPFQHYIHQEQWLLGLFQETSATERAAADPKVIAYGAEIHAWPAIQYRC